ncbi:nucleotidyltransferase domain-containing protein [Methyloprofundus sedimenti]|nr:nucleotidyltransferase domain-containing protein [Methyloprofundus sedimenti]
MPYKNLDYAKLMRLTSKQIDTIKSSVLALDAGAHVYLFGSRVDDTKKGGDIDLLIESNLLTKNDLRKIRWQFFDIFGKQKMDLILESGSGNHEFITMIKPQAVEL